ncbi:MAG: replication-associated recombination protein A [Magnetococcales bacterium]|nr:replication-associated recombination protein A [Magnetococcales bacterium]
MRPETLDEILGQDHLLAPGKIIREAISADRLPSLVFWGPPGCGKTTLARVIARHTHCHFESLSAVLSGVKDVRQVVERAQVNREKGAFGAGEAEGESGEEEGSAGTILFVDEIHRFNKSQQDAFLPFVEDGTIILIGATTENPSFELISALLSRCRVVVLKSLEKAHLTALLKRAVADSERGLGKLSVQLAPELLELIADQAGGDARYALNLLETFVGLSREAIEQGKVLQTEDLLQSLDRRAALYDKAGEGHYNLISAFHKSLRGSDVDASLYWLSRMLAGGEDGLYIARRMVRFASEDIGNADPQALTLTLAAKETFHFLGHPEGELALAQAAVYLATAPKSNSVYMAFKAAQKCAAKSGSLSPPAHILNAPTKLMKELGYGKGYRYAHDHETGYVRQDYLPPALEETRFYEPVNRGFEREISRRLDYWRKLKAQGE